MGAKTVVAGAVFVLGLAAWLLWPKNDVAPPVAAAVETPPVPAPPKPAVARATPETQAPPAESPPKESAAVVERKPSATVVVTAFDPEASALVRGFTCELVVNDRVDRPTPDAEGRIEAVVPLASAAGESVEIVAAKGAASGRRDIALRDGERVEVRIDLFRDGEIRGRVTDAADKPVADALVFFGEEDVARGDEPFKPFDEKRVKNGARTNSDGRFQLSGAGRWITFWHADAGPVTVARGDAANVVLPARGIVRGVVRTADGTSEPNRDVFLDRVRKTTTDGAGRFEFTNVEPGTRGLSLTGGKPKAYVAVRVAAGAAVDVEMKPGLASVRIEWPGRTSLGRFVGLLPLDSVGSMAIGEPDGGIVVAKDVTPGKYLIMGEGGALAVADVAGPTATAVVGTGEIVVRAKPKTRVYVVPAGAGYLARLLGGRMAGAGVPADGVQRFTGLAPGVYDVGVERDGVRTTVEVKDGAVETSID